MPASVTIRKIEGSPPNPAMFVVWGRFDHDQTWMNFGVYAGDLAAQDRARFVLEALSDLLYDTIISFGGMPLPTGAISSAFATQPPVETMGRVLPQGAGL